MSNPEVLLDFFECELPENPEFQSEVLKASVVSHGLYHMPTEDGKVYIVLVRSVNPPKEFKIRYMSGEEFADQEKIKKILKQMDADQALNDLLNNMNDQGSKNR